MGFDKLDLGPLVAMRTDTFGFHLRRYEEMRPGDPDGFRLNV